MTITWDDCDPKRDAFQSGRTPDDKIWVEVYAYPDPADMRRWCYQVNIWDKKDYTLGQPLRGLSGRGGIEAGKRAAKEFFRKVKLQC